MTNEEARKIRSAYSNGVPYPFGISEECDMDEVNRHAALLDDALEKQIPKEVTTKESRNGYDFYICPTCGCITVLRTYKYCQRCGQRFDFSSTYKKEDES